ncbi:MAG: 8-amino-7-oxononanoate synthase [Candidatus Omnitrophota bacterium]
MQNNFFEEQLNSLEKKGFLRKIRVRNSAQDKKISIDGKFVLNFSSNDYLGLCSDKRLKEASIKATRLFGTGTGASRLISGTHELHKKLEEKLACFKNTQSALVFNSGYQVNVGIISSLVGKDDLVLLDRLNHASIIDGIILSRAKFIRYPHNDTKALKKILEENKNFKRKLIVTDTVFSMDGDIAKLNEIVQLKEKYNCLLMVDEAHATGVFGKNGAGLVEHLGLEGKIDLEMGTLSKAFGSFGAYVCASKILVEYLINKCRAFIYTTSLPYGVIASSIKAIEIIEKDKKLRNNLWKNTDYIREKLKNIGFNTLNAQTPIIPILTGDSNLTIKFSNMLFKEGIFACGIRPPTVPMGEARLRLTISAKFTKKDLDFAIEKITKVAKILKII